MKQCYLFLILNLFISCKKENSILANTKPILEIFGGKKIKIDTLLISKLNNKDLMIFYKDNNLETVWQSSDKRNIVISKLLKSDESGLNPKNYDVEKLKDFENKYDNLLDNELVEYDILLSNNIQKYINNLYKGKLNPKKLYNDYDLKEKTIDVNKHLQNILINDNIDTIIENCKPKNKIYKQLENALKIIDAMPYDHSKPMSFSAKGKIKPNENTSLIISIKKRLMYWNYLSKKDTITKIYDKKTVIAVKAYQVNNGLIADGIIGKSTINALNFNKSERREQIVANLERWRWYPEDFGPHHTIVNIPTYTLNVVKDNDTLQNYKVIVGKFERRSPVFQSKLNQVILNPTWTVPPTIIKEDLIPDATKSRRYFGRMRITIFDRKKNKINPYKWNPEKANNYSYVQDPGKNNSLGQMKIIFPNKFAVYLHDTNHKTGFSRNSRSLSSGCTRVENPLGLAEYVLNDSIKWNREKIDAKIAEKKTYPINIPQIIQHYQLYWTAWTEKNKLIFREDTYDLDFELYCKLRE
jgi:L,D-transpeptidase YcbB